VIHKTRHSYIDDIEIGVPIIAAGEVRGVLDIDSDQLATFDETDREYLEKVVDLLVKIFVRAARLVLFM
jgi:GAF domain-containing protein